MKDFKKEKMINLIYTGIFNNCDAPSPWGLYFQDSAVSFNSCFCFIAFHEKYNTHLPNNKTPSENFLTWLIGFVEGEGSFIVNNRGDLAFVITQGTIDKQVLEFIQEIIW